jgi:hypothetical protein
MRTVPTYMYVFEVTKSCGYGAFIMVYKDAPLADIHRFVSYEMGIAPSCRLYFMNPQTREEYDVPNTTLFTVRELIAKFQRNDAATFRLQPIYNDVKSLVVYRLHYDDGITHNHHKCC